jgi:hypothetical protein
MPFSNSFLGKVAFGCVAESTPSFYDQVLRLIRSIRWFGGSLADADVFVCIVGEAGPARRMELEALGAQVRLVSEFNPLNRFCNKIRFLELPELERYETVALLDCDMALVQDPAPYFAQPSLQLKIADLPTVPTAVLARLCAHFGLSAPAPIYRTTCSQEPTIWYCNTAVMILPAAWIAQILPAWCDYILRLCTEPGLFGPPYNHCNQAAMSLVYLSNPLPFSELPAAMNFPLHQTHRLPAPALLREDPVILHYHDRVDGDGLLLPVPYPLAQNRVRQLNERLRATMDSPLAASIHSNATKICGGPPSPSPTLSLQLRDELSADALAMVEAETGDHLDELGYQVQAPGRVAVCISGMHRSGTSLVGQILHHCGLYLGPYDLLAAPAADNRDGYWEHPDVRQLNDDILSHFGGGWDVAPSLPAGWEKLPELEPLRRRALTLIRQFDGWRYWGWKDPRSALTMPFWRQLIPGLKVVICVRNPLEVARSLSQRGMSSLAFGLRLWHTYYERLLAAVAPEDRIVTHYDAYFVDAAAETSRILAWLDIPASPDTIQRVCSSTADELRHHRSTIADLLAVGAPAAVLQLYGRLCGEVGAPGGAALASVAPEGAATDDYTPAAPGTSLAAALALLQAHEAELATLRPAVATSQTEIAILRLVLQAREAEVAFLMPALAARETEIEGYARELETTRAILQAREAEIEGYAQELETMRALVQAREAEIAGYAQELETMRALVLAREAEIAGYARELEATRAMVQARQAEIEGYARELEATRAI